MSGIVTWRFVPFSALTTRELYDLLQLRSEVFVLEQACAFQDLDGADTEASIGRVVTHASARGDGIGHVLMKEAADRLQAHWGPQAIRIGAQARLEKFYNQHGFVQNGEPYIEDGIPHIEMLRVA